MNSENTEILKLRGVIKRYGQVTALDGVSYEVGSGSIVALLGPNGAGKTTTFKCTLGVIDFTGDITVAGHSVKRSGKTVRSLIGYLPQTAAFFGDDTCLDALRFLADLRRVPHSRVDELLERVHLAEQRKMRADQLSGGMRQRLALAASLLSDPPLLLLDEPTANLDFESRGQFHDMLLQLRDEGKTIILSTHFIEHIAHLADRVILLRNGRVDLDKQMDDLVPGGSEFKVYLNGAEPAAFMAALRSIGVTEDKVSPVAPGLEAAIARAMTPPAEEDR